MEHRGKIIKVLNGWINYLLGIHQRVLIFLHLFPRPGLIPQLKHRELCLGWDVVKRTDWESARNEVANVWVEECASVSKHKTCIIQTYRKKAIGYGVGGVEQPERKWVSGKMSSQERFVPRGSFEARLFFDPTAEGNWEAWWFLSDSDKCYQEVDIERMYDSQKDKNHILISVHKGKSATEGRQMYSHRYQLPGNIVRMRYVFGRVLRVYMNGVLVFVGLQWRMTEPMRMIVGSGVRTWAGDSARDGLFLVGSLSGRNIKLR